MMNEAHLSGFTLLRNSSSKGHHGELLVISSP